MLTPAAAKMPHCEVAFFLIFATLIFSASLPLQRDVTVATFNLHGFSTSSKYLKDCVHSHGGVWMVQEHWLSEHQLEKLQQLNLQYVAHSGMEESMSGGIYRGRPFGGVAICWSEDLNHLITPVTNYKHKRVIAVEMKTVDRDILFISAYMPFFNSSNRERCINETIDAITMIELIIEDHPLHDIVFGGDLNTELKSESPFDPLWEEFVRKYSFAYCDSFVSSHNFTYRHDSLNQSKFNDHFLVSKSLIDGICHDHRVLEEGDNCSDHFPLLLKMKLKLQASEQIQNEGHSNRSVNWKKLSEQTKKEYALRLERLLLDRQSPLFVTQCEHACGCKDARCLESIQQEYDDISNCISVASTSLPRGSTGVEKDWWSPALTQLRNQSIDIHALWIWEGRPRQGPTFHERLRVRAAYKHSIRVAKKAPKLAVWNKLHTAMANEDTVSFWKWWRDIYANGKNKVAPVVNGQTTKEGIASAFQDAFGKNSEPNNIEKVHLLDSDFHTKYERFSQNHTHNCDCAHYNITLENMIDAVYSMKQGKCPDDDGFQAEHFQNAPLILFLRLTTLFNHMMSHSFVPMQFRFGTLIPIIKDKNGNISDTSNYRGITISPMISKVFEHVLRDKFSQHLTSSSYQFGFKKKTSTNHALFSLRETVNYYIDNGSRVFCSFLDASKAFDRVVHSGLFSKLIDRNAPKCFIDILIVWYDGLQCRVRWDGFLGQWFSVTAGVRQGGVLSPDLYNIYVDDLMIKLQKSGAGCYICNIFAAALFYADDICILAPSLKGLQRLLDICSLFCQDWDICLNPKKTKNMYFGKPLNISFRPTLNGMPIDWVSQWKYLGVVLQSGKRFGCSVQERVKSFYRSLNAILRVEGRSDDLVLLRLLEAHCVPLITYAIETLHVADRDEKRSLRVAYNSIFRKLFGYRYFESVTNLQHALGRPTWEELVLKRQNGFLNRAQSSESELVAAFC